MFKFLSALVGAACFMASSLVADCGGCCSPCPRPAPVCSSYLFDTCKPCGQKCSSCLCLPEIKVSGSTFFTSEYDFRGKKVAQSSIQPALMLEAPAYCGTVYSKVWMNLPVQRKNVSWFNSDDVTVQTTTGNEIDFTVGYRLPLSLPSCWDACGLSDCSLSLDVGYTYYYYPDHAVYYSANTGCGTPSYGLGHANEIYIGLIADVLLRPSFYTYYDFNREQFVFQGNLFHSFNLGEFDCWGCYDCLKAFSLDLGASLGYLSSYNYLGDGTRNSYNHDNPGADLPKWHNGYLFGSLSADLVCHLTQCSKASIGVAWSANNDGSSGMWNAFRNNVGGYDSLFCWRAGVDFCF